MTIINTGQRRKQHHLHKLLTAVQRLPLMEKTNPKGDVILSHDLYNIIMFLNYRYISTKKGLYRTEPVLRYFPAPMGV